MMRVYAKEAWRLLILSAVVMLVIVLSSCGVRKVQPPPARPGKVVTHRVAFGETWRSIARDFYGDESRAKEIASYNGMKIGEKPEPGSGLRIPLKAGDAEHLEMRRKALSLYNDGLDLASKRRFAAAIETFDRALELDGGIEMARYNKAVCYQNLGMHDRAVKILEVLCRANPKNVDYLFALGNSFFYLGRYSEAEERFDAVLKIKSGHLKALYALATVYEKEGRSEKAIETWRRYLALDGTSEWADEARKHLSSLQGASGGRH